MSNTAEQLVVRQHERFACRIPVDVAVTQESPTRVGLSRTVGNGTGVMSATLVDCSGGGVGIESTIYLPRQTRLLVRIAPDEGGEAPLELEATVQRASMVSRKPMYYLGLSFRGKNAPSAATVDKLMKQAARAVKAEAAAVKGAAA